MELFLSWIRRGLHPCLHCGSFLKSEQLMCQPCLRLIESRLSPNLESSRFMTFDIYTAFRWDPGASDLLSSELVHLKGSKKFPDWRHWAKHFAQRRTALNLPERPIRIVPAPSSKGQKDHAFYWGEALAEQTGAEFVSCLRKGRVRKQRGASRQQRRRVQIEVDENYSVLSKDWSEVLWVFADDIVTTGSTAHAAYEALGSPPHFEVWALAKRSLSCGASMDLL